MTCGEFKTVFKNRLILAFVSDETTHLFKFNSTHITFFMRKFIDEKIPYWRNIFFYELSNLNEEILEDGKITKFEDKARFLYVIAKRLDQKGEICVLKRVLLPPDLSKLEGTRAKLYTLKF